MRTLSTCSKACAKRGSRRSRLQIDSLLLIVGPVPPEADLEPSVLRMSAMGRFLPVAILSPDRLVIGESGRSWIRRQCSEDVSLNDRYRLGAAGQVKVFRQAENDPFRTFDA